MASHGELVPVREINPGDTFIYNSQEYMRLAWLRDYDDVVYFVRADIPMSLLTLNGDVVVVANRAKHYLKIRDAIA